MPNPNTKLKVLAFAGSTRTASWNKKLLRLAAHTLPTDKIEVTTIDLRDYPLPFYDADLEEVEGLPNNAVKLKELFLNHQALLIASPEYNSSYSGVIKNTIDWVSRPRQGEAELACFKQKTAALMSASIGSLGGIRGLVHMRAMLENIGVLVIPEQVCVPFAQTAFNEENLKDENLNRRLENLVQKFVTVFTKMAH